jgi:hypothetical protein
MKRFAVVLVAVIALLAVAPVARALTQVCPALGAKLVRPIKMGASIGVSDANPRGGHCGAGTAGILTVNSSGQQEILTNNHIGALDFSSPLAETINGVQFTLNPYSVGSVWSQPGPYYLSCNNTTATSDGVANYTLAVPEFASMIVINEVDAAVGLIQSGTVSSEILTIGVPSTTVITSPSVGMILQGQGATSCYTQYQITNTDFSYVYFDGEHQWYYDHQYYATGVYDPTKGGYPIPASGDSGTAFLTTGSCAGAVGLLWGGDVHGNAIMSPIWLAMSKLGLSSIVGRVCNPTEAAVTGPLFDVAQAETPASGALTPAPDGALPLPQDFPPDPAFNARANAAEHLKAALDGIPHFWYVDFAHKENGLDDKTLLVMVDRITPQIMDRVPRQYDGFPVKIEVYAGGPNTNLLDDPGNTMIPQGCHKVETATDRGMICDPLLMKKPVIVNPK